MLPSQDLYASLLLRFKPPTWKKVLINTRLLCGYVLTESDAAIEREKKEMMVQMRMREMESDRFRQLRKRP